MKHALIMAAALLVFTPLTALAGDQSETKMDMENHKHDHAAEVVVGHVVPAANEAKIRVSGVVCSFCSQGLQKKLSKLPFVDQSKYKKGVHTSIEDQLVTIALDPEAEADLALIYKKIKSGGYEPYKAWVAGTDGEITIFDDEGEVWNSGT